MIRLNLKSTGPAWVALAAGVEVQCLPLTSVLVGAAASDPRVVSLPDGCSPQEQSVAMAKAIAVRAITAWRGVEDEAGKPLEVSDAAVDALLDVYPIFEAFQIEYVAPAMQVHVEKKGFAPSLSGTSAAARPTAKGAPRAAKSARRSKTAP